MSAHPNAPHVADAGPNTTHLPGHARATLGTVDGVTVAIRNVDKIDGFAGRRFIVVAHNGTEYAVVSVHTTEDAARTEGRKVLVTFASIAFREVAA